MLSFLACLLVLVVLACFLASCAALVVIPFALFKKRFRLAGWASLGLVVAFWGFCTLIEPTDWLDAKRDNTITSYNRYLRKHPKGRWVNDARRLLRDLAQPRQVLLKKLEMEAEPNSVLHAIVQYVKALPREDTAQIQVFVIAEGGPGRPGVGLMPVLSKLESPLGIEWHSMDYAPDSNSSPLKPLLTCRVTWYPAFEYHVVEGAGHITAFGVSARLEFTVPGESLTTRQTVSALPDESLTVSSVPRPTGGETWEETIRKNVIQHLLEELERAFLTRHVLR